MTGARTVAYRDSAHFYHPLYAWITDRGSGGKIPLWNSQENIGQPVIGGTTSAVFYPGKLVFCLPGDYRLHYNLYIVLHHLMAAWGAYRLARHWRASVFAGALAGVSYAYGGIVLFQYCNVVFLVGAAWLPMALLATDQLYKKRTVGSACGLGICLACMTLGGAPQTAYHAGLFATLYPLVQGTRTRSSIMAPRAGTSRLARSPRYLLLLICAATAGSLLAAVQIVPAVSWTRTSERAVFDRPRSIYEIVPFLTRSPAWDARDLEPRQSGTQRTETSNIDSPEQNGVSSRWSDVGSGLFARPVAGTHHSQLYSFSVAPWRLAEMVWPNISGETFPINRRWLTAARAEDRIWAPSLYLGLVPLLLGLRTWRLRAGAAHLRWLSWMVLLCVVASFGWYGPGWIFRALLATMGWESDLGEPTGGIYWLMVVGLPGYAEFRFPAKLLVPAALGLSVLAAVGLDQMLASGRVRFRRGVAGVGVASAAVGMAVALCGPWFVTWFSDARADELFGPFDARGAWWNAFGACLHTTTVCGIVWWVLRKPSRPSAAAFMLLIVTAIELAWANGWMVMAVPSSALDTPALTWGLVQDPVAPRLYRPPDRSWVPHHWKSSSSERRPDETLRWDRATLYPHFHLLGRCGSVHSPGTMTSHDFHAFLEAADRDADRQRVVLDVLGTSYFILPQDHAICRQGFTERHSPSFKLTLPNQIPNVCMLHNESAFPRAWLVHHWEVWPELRSTDPQSAQLASTELLFPADTVRNLRTTAVVESDSPQPYLSATQPAGPQNRETCRLLGEEPERFEMAVTLESPALVVTSRLFCDGWQVSLLTKQNLHLPTKVVRTNRVMQGVFLPAGNHHLLFQYKPRDFYVAAWISFGSWLVALFWLGGVAAHRLRIRWKQRVCQESLG